MMDKKTVAIQKCDNYDQAAVDAAVQRIFNDLGGVDKFVASGQNVFLKVNLVSGAAPAACVTTHPSVISAVAKIVVRAGASVTVGDSPGGPYTKGYVNGVYKKSGLVAMCETLKNEGIDISLNQDFSDVTVDFPDGVVAKKIPVLGALEKADVIINIAKMKTHSFAGFTAACKNMYGAIPGLVKVQWHQHFQDINTFCNCLIDIQEYFRPKLLVHFVDAVDAMEGPGPTSGTPVHVGLLLASECYSSVDIPAVRLMAEMPRFMPTLFTAVQRKILNPEYEIEIKGQQIEEFINNKYKVTPPSVQIKMGKTRFTRWFVKRALQEKPKVSKSKCKGCGKCKEHCPVQAIGMKSKGNNKTYASFDLNKCIRCFCCQELCPFNLVKVKTPLFAKYMKRKRKR
jgi:uncharacterized protein (DUF362 family)/Pyruvate/2-oxoacid:ferredoxin oxidoreductase delta subunit